MKLTRISRVAQLVSTASFATLLSAGSDLAAQAAKAASASAKFPLTRPELSDYAETSRYDDVIAYMKLMAAANPQIHLKTYGYTYEGRALPLAVIGAPGSSAAQVIATGKTRVYIQANIHAGEVEGKEAVLWLLRSIAKGERNE
ncbi:MAG: hypothetical protein H7Z40_01535, partial [Phycisphaerae bacterium]|nr:hypothetical protein [Gemmatimonadaceae bacterium]